MNALRRPRSLLASVAVLAAAGATALGTSGCGASNVIDPVASAATVSNATPGFRMTLGMTFSAPGTQFTMSGTGSGSMDVRDRAGALHVSLQLPNLPQITQALGSSTLSMDEITRGMTIYLKMPAAIAERLSGGKPWIRFDLAKQAAAMGLSGLGSLSSANPMSTDPGQMLQYLRAASGGVTKAGTATVAGHPTTAYRATIDLSKVPNLVPAADRAAARQSIQRLEALAHIRQLPMEVWIDGQHLVRRLAVTMHMPLGSTGQTMAMAMTITIPQYGPQPLPALPPASQVTDASTLGAAGGTSSPGSGIA
jgi:hypothetical protein